MTSRFVEILSPRLRRRHKKAPPGSEDSSGAIVAELRIFGPFWAIRELQPFRSVTQADSAQERPQREAGARGSIGEIND
jgi:hypothetical protein